MTLNYGNKTSYDEVDETHWILYGCVCVCVCVCVYVLAKVVIRVHPWVLLQVQNWAYISHRAYARLFKVAKTMQNELSIDHRGTLVVYNVPARFTYWVPTCVWMIAGTIQMGIIQKKNHTSPVVVYAPLLSIKPQFLLTKLNSQLKFD